MSFLHHVAEYTGQLPKEPDQHSGLVHKILLLSAWVQLGAVVGVMAVSLWWLRRWRKRARVL